MNLNKRSHTLPLPEVPMESKEDFAIVTERAADCIRNVIPHPMAILVPGKNPRTYNPGDFPVKHLTQIRNHFESNPHLFTDLMQDSNSLGDPYRLSDGSLAFFLPLAQNGSLEAVLCLYDSSGRDKERLQQQLSSLDPICTLTAMLISNARGSEAKVGSQTADPSQGDSLAMARLAAGLLRTISHDIRTPITTVRGFVKMMLDGRTGPISDSQRECLQMAFQGVDQLIKIGTSISDTSGHIEKIHAEIVDVPGLWQAVQEVSRPLMQAKSVTIDDSIEGDRRTVCGDRQYLINLFERLLACAVNAVENHGKLCVTFRCRSEITLMLTIPGIQGARSLPYTDDELAPAREIAFLHGGQITVRQGKEGDSILMLVLPGYIE